MPRKNYNSTKIHSVQAGKERCGMRILQAFRMLDAESSSLLSGIILSMEQDNAIPKLRTVPMSHQVRILDPHLVRKELSSGVRTSKRVAAALEGCAKNALSTVDCISDAKISQLSIPTGANGRRRAIVASLEHPVILHDRVSLYSELGKHGLHGFSQRAEAPGHPTCVLGVFEEPLSHVEAEGVIDVLETGLVIGHGLDVGMGRLRMLTDRPLLD